MALIACAAVWAFGVVRFAAGSEVLGGVLIVGAGLIAALLIGLYRNGRKGAAESVGDFVEKAPWG